MSVAEREIRQATRGVRSGVRREGYEIGSYGLGALDLYVSYFVRTDVTVQIAVLALYLLLDTLYLMLDA